MRSPGSGPSTRRAPRLRGNVPRGSAGCPGWAPAPGPLRPSPRSAGRRSPGGRPREPRRGGARAPLRALAALLLFPLPLPSACAPGGESAPRAIKLGHVGNPGSLYEVTAAEYARLVNERLPSGWTLEVYGSSQLGGDEVLLQKLRLGTVDLSLPSTVMSSTIPAFGLFEMPYLVRDREHMRAIEEALVWPTLVPIAEERGYRVLAVWENGFRHVTNNVRPIRVPADLRDIKLRTPRGVWRVKLFQAMGANPTPMAFSEVFVALQTGVMDGQENPLSQIWSARLHEVQEYLSLTGHVYTPAFLTAGASWETLPEAVRTVLAETAREIQPFVYEQAVLLDERLLEELRASGIRVNEADPAAFREAMEPVYEEFVATVEGGADMLERAGAAGAPSTAEALP